MTDAARLSNEDLEYCLGEMTTGPVSRADVDIIRTHIVVIEGELEAERLRADAAEQRTVELVTKGGQSDYARLKADFTNLSLIAGTLETEKRAAEERAAALQRALVGALKYINDDAYSGADKDYFKINHEWQIALLDPDARKEVCGE